MPPVDPRLVLSCEHASNRVPKDLAFLFRRRDLPILATHRGFDAGALEVARGIARRLGAPLVAGGTTRLIVDLNRSPHNRSLYSDWTRDLPLAARRRLVARLHAPHWARVARMVDDAASPVVHVAVHSFTPVLHGRVRPLELGLLYDPARPLERRFADRIAAGVARRSADLRVRRNAPYRGVSDCLPTALRRTRRPEDYLGLELELNQAALQTARARRAWAALLAEVLGEALGALPRRSTRSRPARRQR